MGWVGLLRLLQLGVLQIPTITIGQAVLLQEDIITHLAVLHLAKLILLQVATTTIGLPVPLQVDTTAIGQQPTAESRSLSG